MALLDGDHSYRKLPLHRYFSKISGRLRLKSSSDARLVWPGAARRYFAEPSKTSVVWKVLSTLVRTHLACRLCTPVMAFSQWASRASSRGSACGCTGCAGAAGGVCPGAAPPLTTQAHAAAKPSILHISRRMILLLFRPRLC